MGSVRVGAVVAILLTMLAPLRAHANEATVDAAQATTVHSAPIGEIYDLRPPPGRATSQDRPPKPLTFVDLVDALSKARFVLLGEIHDNDMHHRWQAAILTALAGGVAHLNAAAQSEPSPAPAVVFEQIAADKAPALTALVDKARKSGSAPTVAEVKVAVGWATSGWSANGYDSVLAATLSGGFAIVAGDVERRQMRAVAKRGAAALSTEDRASFHINVPLGDANEEAAMREIEDAHCGMLPKSALAGMATAQRYRDAHLARAMTDTGRHGGRAILIAGQGHVRRDRGAPWYLDRMAPGSRVGIVWLAEASESNAGNDDLRSLVARGADGKPVADFLIVAPRVPRPDPCEQMRKR